MIPLTQDAYRLFHEGTLALADIEARGLRIDTDYLEDQGRRVDKTIDRLEQELREHEMFEVWQHEYGLKAKLGSRSQLAHVLYDVLKFPSPNETDNRKRRNAADKEALELIDSDFVRTYSHCESLKRLKATFILGVLRETCDGILHASYNLNIASTYRSSSDSPNFQNLPVRDKLLAKIIRRAFIPRDSNYFIVESDFSGIEVRVSACYNKDPRLIKYITDPTTDMHRDMAAQCYKLEQDQVTKDARYCAKNKFVFPEFYGDWYMSCAQALWASIDSMDLQTVDGIGMKKHLADKGIRKLGACDPEKNARPGTFEHHLKRVENDFWNNRFKVYQDWKQKWYRKYRDRGGFQMLTGFACTGLLSRKQVINYPVQGSAFHCLLWSIIEINNWLKLNKMKTRIIGQIHDSIVADVHKDELEDYCEHVRYVTTRKLLEHFPWIIVPMEIEIEGSDENWYAKKALAI